MHSSVERVACCVTYNPAASPIRRHTLTKIASSLFSNGSSLFLLLSFFSVCVGLSVVILPACCHPFGFGSLLIFYKSFSVSQSFDFLYTFVVWIWPAPLTPTPLARERES